VEIGCCAGIDRAREVYEAGFDYLECTVVSLQPETDEASFEAMYQRQFAASPLPIKACNVFLPGDMPVVGEDVNWERVDRYLETAFARIKRIGADTVVFGSGRSRRIPEDFSREKAEQQIVEFLQTAAEKADPWGITIAIEPLNTKECNILNTVAEAAAMAEQVNRAPVQVLADLYHMQMDDEPLENVLAAGPRLQHIHVADRGRRAPGTGSYPYGKFADLVRKAGYDRRVSVECRWNDFAAEADKAVQFLRRHFG